MKPKREWTLLVRKTDDHILRTRPGAKPNLGLGPGRDDVEAVVVVPEAVLCPDGEVCHRCPCAADDDVCFPGERLRAELEASRQQLAGAVERLEAIRERVGAVCATYETCEHESCQASYTAWALADAYLRGQ